MPAGSQGSVLASKPPASSLESRKRLAPLDQHRPGVDKKPRLDALQGRTDKENALPSNRGGLGGMKDEQRMMDDLMAGLDASMFDGLDSSPVNSQKQKLSQRSPLVHRSQIKSVLSSPSKIASRALAPSRPPVSESENGQKVTSPDVKLYAPASKTIKAERPPLLPALQQKVGSPKLDRKDVKGPLEDYLPAAVTPIKAERSIPSTILDQKPIIQLDDKQDITVRVEDVKSGLEDEEDFSFDFDLDDFADMDEDMLLKPQSAAQSIYPIPNPEVPKPPPGYRSTPWARCTVEAVYCGLLFTDGDIPDDLNRGDVAGPSRDPNKTLVVSCSSKSKRLVVHLRERWADMPVKQGDTVNIISPALDLGDGPAVIDISFKSPSTFLIHHPDIMLTMTSIANAMPCTRKPILQTMVKAAGPATKPILYGNMGHTLLQSALSTRNFTPENTRLRLDEELKKESIKLDIWGAGMGIEDVRTEIGIQSETGFQAFGDKWITGQPKAEGELHKTPGEPPTLLAISGLHDIEEDIWSPKWGLKGKVDASVQASISKTAVRPGEEVEQHVAPLEIKTGRAMGVMAHRAQTMLYTLLMEDRYGVPVPAGLLYYSKLDSILRVEARPNEIRALIMARNELAVWMAKKRSLAPAEPRPPSDVEDATFLPPTIDNARECKMCYANDSCMLYRKTVDRVPVSEDDEIMELYLEKAGHITETHAEFFRKWDDLLTVEEQDAGRLRTQLWTMTADRREKSGRCFADMVLASYSDESATTLQKIHRHTYTFERATQQASGDRPSLLSGHIAKGDPVSISMEPDLLCLQRGFVTDLTPTSVVLGLTYKIEVESLLSKTKHRRTATTNMADVRFRIDKDEMSSGIMRMRNNLAQLFYKEGDEKRRRLVVDLEKPYFEPARAPQPGEIPPSLNVDQAKAMHQVLTARDYALVLGMPGTGKTTTIAEIIKALVERGKSVLLTSYTHSAVDTILMKLLDAKFGILRLGNVDKVHPSVRGFTLDGLPPTTSMAQMDNRLMDPPVVAATCLAIDHSLFFRRKFDYCIVDEASQITLPTCLGPLRMADTFVLVGDHFQLPPIVKNPEARRGGLDVSLFKLLSEKHPQAVVDLSHQYRMNEDIMLLSNRLIYEDRLKCGSDQVAKQGLVVPNLQKCPTGPCDESCWLQHLMLESTKAVFVDTDQVPALDSRVGDLVQNETEAHLVQQLATALVGSGVKQEDIAIITPYRQQIKLLASRIRHSMGGIEILTADKSQGRDKDCIIISLVRSNEDGNIGELLRDWRRINVSFTRAKKKLVIFGSAKTLAGDKMLKGFLDLMDSQGWIMRLKPGADKLHPNLESETAIKVKKEEPDSKPVKREGKLGDRILNGRPFLAEALNNL